MPTITGIVETALYVENLDRATEFYKGLFGFDVLERDDRFVALGVPGPQVLLLFLRGASVHPTLGSAMSIPPHDATGSQHLAFSVPMSSLPEWETRLSVRGLAIESRNRWPRGGTSLFFRDPDQHLVELATPGIWAVY